MQKRTLVIYHSVQGNTERVANAIAAKLACDLIKINKKDISTTNIALAAGKVISHLMQSKQFKNTINNLDLSQYDRIFIGGPCWNYTYTPAVSQFLKEADYRGKEIVFFLTHDGGPGKTVEKFKAALNGGKFLGAMDFYGVRKMEQNELENIIRSQLIRFK